ncbi:Pimeloyl-ACP methyl ester carboxylesterase [Balamuthia mandrillaris]
MMTDSSTLVPRTLLCSPLRPETAQQRKLIAVESTQRKTLGEVLCCEFGFRVLVPDIRGHGRSRPASSPSSSGLDWSYDDIVLDTGAFIELAERIDPCAPVALVGHSLCGHTFPAYLGMASSLSWSSSSSSAPSSPTVIDNQQQTKLLSNLRYDQQLSQHADAVLVHSKHADRVKAVVSIAGNTWQQRHCASRRRWFVKLASCYVALVILWTVGRYPTSWFRRNATDEAFTYFSQTLMTFVRNEWKHRGSGWDYNEGLKRIRCPFLHLLSERDVLTCNPEDALLFSATIPTREALLLSSTSEEKREKPQGGNRIVVLRSETQPPDHMQLVTSPELSLAAWRWLGTWLSLRLSASPPPSPALVAARF